MWPTSWTQKEHNVNWDSLFNLLSRMGSGDRQRRWIRPCVTTVHFSTQANGSTLLGLSTWGLKQGDLLSLLLFHVIMEVSPNILKKIEESGLIHGFHVRLYHFSSLFLYCNFPSASKAQWQFIFHSFPLIKLHIKPHSKVYTLQSQKLIPTHRNQYLHQYPWEISIVGQTTKKINK